MLFRSLEEQRDGEVVDLVVREEVERVRGYPKLVAPATVGADGEFMVGAAVGTREDDKERLEHLVKAGLNVVVLDSSQGNSIYQLEMVKYVKRVYPELDVIGGNVVTLWTEKNPGRRFYGCGLYKARNINLVGVMLCVNC